MTTTESFESAVWLVSDYESARSVLRGTDFRTATPAEYVPGRSMSFFLPADVLPPEDAKRLATALTGATTAPRVSEYRDRVLRPAALTAVDRLRRLPAAERDVEEHFVRPYTRTVAYALAGVPADEGAEIAGLLSVALEILAEDSADPRGRAVHGAVWHRIHQLAAADRIDTLSIPGHALSEGRVAAEEVAFLAVPILEMAVTGKSADLLVGAIEAGSVLSDREQAVFSTVEGARALVAGAVGRLPGIQITRVAERDGQVGETRYSRGDRIILDVEAANLAGGAVDGEVQPLSFGDGGHACRGRELAMSLAAVAVQELFAAGVFSSSEHESGAWLPRS